MLEANFRKEKIEGALKDMKPMKSSGLDGACALFFHYYWDVVSCNIVKICLKILNQGVNFEDINHTYIALISKVNKLNKLYEFRFD